MRIIRAHVTLKNISGPKVEEGATAVERATHKNLYAARSLYTDGYFDRHPDSLVLLVAADSRNRYQGDYRDKPRSIDEFMQDGEELAKVAGAESRLIDETGYSVLVINGARMHVATTRDCVESHPLGRHIIESVFQPDNYWRYRAFAQGFPSALMVQSDHLRVISCSGSVICGQAAIDRTMGASRVHFETLIKRAISTFAH